MAAGKLSSEFTQDGWYKSAAHQYSPNVDARPHGCAPELLVIHAISLPLGQFSDASTESTFVDDLFLNRLNTAAHPDFAQLAGVRVSAHFFIRRDGSLTQFVGVKQRAWHAGVSEFMKRTRCNDFSVGIEMEGSDFVPFEAAQYTTLTNLTGALLQQYPIEHIVGHQDIAPGRKTDPGPFFDWRQFQKLLRLHFPLVSANFANADASGH